MISLMNKEEARKIQNKEICSLRTKSYEELKRILEDSIKKDIKGESGKVYQVEIQAFWDDKEDEDLRVSVLIDDGGWRAFFPLCEDFIIAPDGSFVGE